MNKSLIMLEDKLNCKFREEVVNKFTHHKVVLCNAPRTFFCASGEKVVLYEGKFKRICAYERK